MTPSPHHSSRRTTLAIIGRDVGALLLLLAALFVLPLAVALLYGEVYTALSFLAASGASAAVGSIGYWTCRDAP